MAGLHSLCVRNYQMTIMHLGYHEYKKSIQKMVISHFLNVVRKGTIHLKQAVISHSDSLAICTLHLVKDSILELVW